jgi:hypothetical protein
MIPLPSGTQIRLVAGVTDMCHRHFHGVLQADAYTGYDQLFSDERKGGTLKEAACWVHARRKIHDVSYPLP